ncbi:MAG: DUF3135 domain-containing protein [Pseudomonadota bacterium]
MTLATKLPRFDVLVAMHEKDPDAYETLRHQLLRSCIDNAPEIHRAGLEALLDRINIVRAEAGTPLEAAIAASRMMVDSCLKLREAMVDLATANAALQTTVLLDKFRL